MAKKPVVTGGNTEAATAARALVRYIKEDKAQNHTSDRDAALNTYVFCCGVVLSFGVTLPQLAFCFLSLAWQITKAKWVRK